METNNYYICGRLIDLLGTACITTFVKLIAKYS